jgi:hypothetical protein
MGNSDLSAARIDNAHAYRHLHQEAADVAHTFYQLIAPEVFRNAAVFPPFLCI